MAKKAFSADISKWCKKAGEKAGAVARMTCFDMAEMVVMMTPVDTGYARGGWQPSLMTAISGVNTLDASGAVSINEISLVTAQMKIGDVFYMTNNVAYIWDLEYGSSLQAPKGMVRITVAKAKAIAQKNINIVKAWT